MLSGTIIILKELQLKCAVNDATEITAICCVGLGYDVIEKLSFRVRRMSRYLTSFEDKIKYYDASIFYYAEFTWL